MSKRMLLIGGVGVVLLLLLLVAIPSVSMPNAVFGAPDNDQDLLRITPTLMPTHPPTATLRLTHPPTATLMPIRNTRFLHDDSLINPDPACLAPCWRGITPGESLWSDALKTLENDPDFDNVEVQGDDFRPAFLANFQVNGAAYCCQMFTENGETVNTIILRVAPNISVGQVIVAQGEPSYLFASRVFSNDQAEVSLVYPDKGLLVHVFIAGASGRLSESSEVIAVTYMSPVDMDLLIKTNDLYEWKGYQAYRVYDTGSYDVTPSMTLTPWTHP